MPKRVHGQCVRCGALINGRTVYCQAHKPMVIDNRPSKFDRGYQSEFNANRKALLASNPPCTVCGERGCTLAHHIIPKRYGGTDALSNLAPVHVGKCHATAERQSSLKYNINNYKLNINSGVKA